MFSESIITTNCPGDMAHRTPLLIDLILGEEEEFICQILVERRGVCPKVAFAIQNQRYL